MRVLLDEMLGPAIADALREGGVDVLAICEESQLRGMSDFEVLALAAAESRIVVTENVLDFRRLETEWAADGRAHSGILYVHSRTFPMRRGRGQSIAQALLSRHTNSCWPVVGSSDFLSASDRPDLRT